MKTENSQKYHVFLVALIFIISVSFIYLYYTYVASPTGLAAFNESNAAATNFPPAWSFNSTVFRINKNSELVLDLNQYFSDPDNNTLGYLATQPSSFAVLLEGSVLSARPEQNFIGERTIAITVSDETNIVNQDITIIVEETSASFNEGAAIQDVDNKFVGKKVVDETEFETYFNYIVKNETGLFLGFYHDSSVPQNIWIEGNITYELSQNVSLANENVTLAVFRVNGVVPKFKLHIGGTSEVFEFGKDIPEVVVNEGVPNSVAEFSFIDRDDELLDVEVSQDKVRAVIRGINVSEVEVKMGLSAEPVLNTEVFAAEPIAMEEAEIVLSKSGNVDAIMECADFDLASFSCNGSWANSGLAFTENDTHIFFTVSHFSGYGGADIDVLTVQSYPMVGSIWTVAFNVSGTANLTITAEDGTVFGTDLVFLSLSCGDAVIPASYDGTTVFYENFNCSSIAYEKSTVLSRGKHTLKFLFGNETDYAFNEAYSGVYNLSTANFSVYGESPSDHAGYSIATADFNGDSIKDLLIGAPDYNSGSRADVGKAYVVLGPFPTDGSALNLSNANASWFGANASDKAGFAVAGGDVNADGYDDVVIGAPYADKDAQPTNLDVGMVYLFYGSAGISGSYNLSNISGANGFNASYRGQNGSDHIGWSLAVGNLSGDARDDIVIGSPDWHDTAVSTPGRVYVIFGAIGFLAEGNRTVSDADNSSFIGESDLDQFGFDVAVGDVTGDGKGDLIAGAVLADTPAGASDAGKIYIVNGSLSNDMSVAATVTTHANGSYYGEGPTSNLGYSLDAGGDVNNDTIADFIAGAYLDDNTITNRGAAYLVYGRTAYSANTNISVVANASWRGQAGNDELGYSVLLGNLLNDSFADVFISSYNQSSVGGNLAGRFYIIYGQNVTESLGQNISVAANASWHTQFQGSGGVMASGSLWIGSWSEGYDSTPLDPTDSPVTEPGRGYMVSGVNPVITSTPSPGPGGGGGGSPGPSPTPTLCKLEDKPVTVNTPPPIYQGDVIDVTVTTRTNRVTVSIPTMGIAFKLNPFDATMKGDMYTWNIDIEISSLANPGLHQIVVTYPDGTICGGPTIFEVEPQLCDLPPTALTPVTGKDIDYSVNSVVSFLDREDDLFQVIGSTRMVPRGSDVARDNVNIPSKVTVQYCDGQKVVTADVPLTAYDSYFGDLVSVDFMVAKYQAEAGLASGVISSDAIAPAAVAGITGASVNRITGRALTEFSGFTEHVTSSCVGRNPSGELSISTSSCVPKDCPSGQVVHWCDCACVPEEFDARDTARLREIMGEEQAMLPSAPSAGVAVGDVVDVPQVFGGGTGSTLFDGKLELPEVAFKHPIGVKVEYPDGSVLGVDHPDADEMRRSMEFMQMAQEAQPTGRAGGGGGSPTTGTFGDPRRPPPGSSPLQSKLGKGMDMLDQETAGKMEPVGGGAEPKSLTEVEGASKNQSEQKRRSYQGRVVMNTPVVPGKVGKPSGLNSITGVVGSGTSVGSAYLSSSKGMGLITGLAGGSSGGGMPSVPGLQGGGSSGLPPGYFPVDHHGHESPDVPPPCTPPTIPKPQPSPSPTPTPQITPSPRPTPTPVATPTPTPTPTPVITPTPTPTPTVQTSVRSEIMRFFPVAPEIALIQRFGGVTNIWTGTDYENAWVGMGPNMGPTGEFGPGVGGGVSAPSQPEPEPETPAPSEGEEGPEYGEGEVSGGKTSGSEGIPGAEAPESMPSTESTPVSTGSTSPSTPTQAPSYGEGGVSGGKTSSSPTSSAVIVDINPKTSFWSWLRGLFG